jgi:GTP-binding protein HflX
MSELESERAVLIAVQLPDVTDEEHESNLAELSRLVKTLGYNVVGSVTQKRATLAHGAVLGEGKLEELARWTRGSGKVEPPARFRPSKARERFEDDADEDVPTVFDPDFDDTLEGAGPRASVVVVDHEITPSQARNLERATNARVLDRTGVIVEIFHRHAKSREARLQVEIARLNYVAPRLRETGRSSTERQAGRGAGESALELDRRRVRDRIAELRNEIESIRHEQDNRRAHRREARRVALVGYTNAGKSSLMRALTGSEVYVADKLFATLDTTVRALFPEVRPRILVSDTVGFIKKLPHDLVASFRSTLDEALEASLLLHLVDAGDAGWEAQRQVTLDVLRDIGAADVPLLLVLNKADRLEASDRDRLRKEHPEALLISAKRVEDVALVRERILAWFDAKAEEAELRVPYARLALVSQIHASARVLAETYDEDGALVRVRAEPDELGRLRALLERAD